MIREIQGTGDEQELKKKAQTVVDRENEYQQRRYMTQQLSPERIDPFSAKTPDVTKRNFGAIMVESHLENERIQMQQKII